MDAMNENTNESIHWKQQKEMTLLPLPPPSEWARMQAKIKVNDV